MGKSLLGKLPATESAQEAGTTTGKILEGVSTETYFLFVLIRNTGLKKTSTSELIS